MKGSGVFIREKTWCARILIPTDDRLGMNAAHFGGIVLHLSDWAESKLLVYEIIV